MSKKIKIAINANIQPNVSSTGGVASVLMGLICALGQLDGPEEFHILGPAAHNEWLMPYLEKNQKLVRLPHTALSSWLKRELQNFLMRAPGIYAPSEPALRISQGFYESLGCSVIHFPYQEFVLCALPTVYTPHDLQYRHYPQFFTATGIAERDRMIHNGCHYAQAITAGSEWIKQDIIRQYQIPPGKIHVIPWAAPTTVSASPAQEMLAATREKYHLPGSFCIYPAVTWPHKNHLRLLQALTFLRDHHNVRVNLVCTGGKVEPSWSEIQAYISENALSDQVIFLGYIPQQDLRALYKLADFAVIPTLFEAASGPIFESWQDAIAVACSNVTSLPEQVQTAGLIFDPYSVESIANTIQILATDRQTRMELAARGQNRLADFSWERTAKAYRAQYRRLAGVTLSQEDQELIGWDWMRFPNKSKSKE